MPETSASIIAGNGKKTKPEDKTSKMEGLGNKAHDTGFLIKRI